MARVDEAKTRRETSLALLTDYASELLNGYGIEGAQLLEKTCCCLLRNAAERSRKSNLRRIPEQEEYWFRDKSAIAHVVFKTIENALQNDFSDVELKVFPRKFSSYYHEEDDKLLTVRDIDQLRCLDAKLGSSSKDSSNEFVFFGDKGLYLLASALLEKSIFAKAKPEAVHSDGGPFSALEAYCYASAQLGFLNPLALQICIKNLMMVCPSWRIKMLRACASIVDPTRFKLEDSRRWKKMFPSVGSSEMKFHHEINYVSPSKDIVVFAVEDKNPGSGKNRRSNGSFVVVVTSSHFEKLVRLIGGCVLFVPAIVSLRIGRCKDEKCMEDPPMVPEEIEQEDIQQLEAFTLSLGRVFTELLSSCLNQELSNRDASIRVSKFTSACKKLWECSISSTEEAVELIGEVRKVDVMINLEEAAKLFKGVERLWSVFESAHTFGLCAYDVVNIARVYAVLPTPDEGISDLEFALDAVEEKLSRVPEEKMDHYRMSFLRLAARAQKKLRDLYISSGGSIRKPSYYDPVESCWQERDCWAECFPHFAKLSLKEKESICENDFSICTVPVDWHSFAPYDVSDKSMVLDSYGRRELEIVHALRHAPSMSGLSPLEALQAAKVIDSYVAEETKAESGKLHKGLRVFAIQMKPTKDAYRNMSFNARDLSRRDPCSAPGASLRRKDVFTSHLVEYSASGDKFLPCLDVSSWSDAQVHEFEAHIHRMLAGSTNTDQGLWESILSRSILVRVDMDHVLGGRKDPRAKIKVTHKPLCGLRTFQGHTIEGDTTSNLAGITESLRRIRQKGWLSAPSKAIVFMDDLVAGCQLNRSWVSQQEKKFKEATDLTPREQMELNPYYLVREELIHDQKENYLRTITNSKSLSASQQFIFLAEVFQGAFLTPSYVKLLLKPSWSEYDLFLSSLDVVEGVSSSADTLALAGLPSFFAELWTKAICIEFLKESSPMFRKLTDEEQGVLIFLPKDLGGIGLTSWNPTLGHFSHDETLDRVASLEVAHYYYSKQAEAPAERPSKRRKLSLKDEIKTIRYFSLCRKQELSVALEKAAFLGKQILEKSKEELVPLEVLCSNPQATGGSFFNHQSALTKTKIEILKKKAKSEAYREIFIAAEASFTEEALSCFAGSPYKYVQPIVSSSFTEVMKAQLLAATSTRAIMKMLKLSEALAMSRRYKSLSSSCLEKTVKRYIKCEREQSPILVKDVLEQRTYQHKNRGFLDVSWTPLSKTLVHIKGDKTTWKVGRMTASCEKFMGFQNNTRPLGPTANPELYGEVSRQKLPRTVQEAFSGARTIVEGKRLMPGYEKIVTWFTGRSGYGIPDLIEVVEQMGVVLEEPKSGTFGVTTYLRASFRPNLDALLKTRFSEHLCGSSEFQICTMEANRRVRNSIIACAEVGAFVKWSFASDASSWIRKQAVKDLFSQEKLEELKAVPPSSLVECQLASELYETDLGKLIRKTIVDIASKETSVKDSLSKNISGLGDNFSLHEIKDPSKFLEESCLELGHIKSISLQSKSIVFQLSRTKIESSELKDSGIWPFLVLGSENKSLFAEFYNGYFLSSTQDLVEFKGGNANYERSTTRPTVFGENLKVDPEHYSKEKNLDMRWLPFSSASARLSRKGIFSKKEEEKVVHMFHPISSSSLLLFSKSGMFKDLEDNLRALAREDGPRYAQDIEKARCGEQVKLKKHASRYLYTVRSRAMFDPHIMLSVILDQVLEEEATNASIVSKLKRKVADAARKVHEIFVNDPLGRMIVDSCIPDMYINTFEDEKEAFVKTFRKYFIASPGFTQIGSLAEGTTLSSCIESAMKREYGGLGSQWGEVISLMAGKKRESSISFFGFIRAALQKRVRGYEKLCYPLKNYSTPECGGRNFTGQRLWMSSKNPVKEIEMLITELEKASLLIGKGMSIQDRLFVQGSFDSLKNFVTSQLEDFEMFLPSKPQEEGTFSIRREFFFANYGSKEWRKKIEEFFQNLIECEKPTSAQERLDAFLPEARKALALLRKTSLSIQTQEALLSSFKDQLVDYVEKRENVSFEEAVEEESEGNYDFEAFPQEEGMELHDRVLEVFKREGIEPSTFFKTLYIGRTSFANMVNAVEKAFVVEGLLAATENEVAKFIKDFGEPTTPPEKRIMNSVIEEAFKIASTSRLAIGNEDQDDQPAIEVGHLLS